MPRYVLQRRKNESWLYRRNAQLTSAYCGLYIAKSRNTKRSHWGLIWLTYSTAVFEIGHLTKMRAGSSPGSCLHSIFFESIELASSTKNVNQILVCCWSTRKPLQKSTRTTCPWSVWPYRTYLHCHDINAPLIVLQCKFAWLPFPDALFHPVWKLLFVQCADNSS